MQKTMTPALIDKLNKACKGLCRCGKCNMECDVHGAHFGWCEAAWRGVDKDGGR